MSKKATRHTSGLIAGAPATGSLPFDRVRGLLRHAALPFDTAPAEPAHLRPAAELTSFLQTLSRLRLAFRVKGGILRANSCGHRPRTLAMDVPVWPVTEI